MYSIAFGRGTFQFDLPSSIEGHVVEGGDYPTLPDPDQAVVAALENPLDSPRLRDIVKPGQAVAVVVTDMTRPCPDDRLVPKLLDELHRGGVQDGDITIIIGIGTHRRSTTEERVEMLGQAVVDRIRVIDPNPSDPETLVDLGKTRSGVPVFVNKTVVEADVVVATGLVEPHLYAGYSGGVKTVAVGAAGEATIGYTHGPGMLDRPGTRLGLVQGNPFREALNEIAERAGLRFVLNVVMNDAGRMVAVEAGAPLAVHHSLVKVAEKVFTTTIPEQADVAVAGIGYPKDSNLYQASRVATNLFFAPTPVVREGGIVILLAPCQEGAGQGPGERRFHEIMKQAESPASVVTDARQRGYKPGGQRAFVVSKVLDHYEIVVVGSECPDVVSDVHMVPLQSLDEALAYAQSKLGANLKAVIMPHALLTIPVVAS